MSACRLISLIALLAFCLPLPGCQVISVAQPDAPWILTDLKLLEAPGSVDPTFDLIAAYERETGHDIELRFDILGSPNLDMYDFYLAVDFTAQGAGAFPLDGKPAFEWDLLLIYPAHGLPRSITSNGRPADVRPRSLRGEISDSITVWIEKQHLGTGRNKARYQAFITQPGSTSVEDSIGPFERAARVSNEPAPLALLFWEALPAATPAQALRRWDGAHTGPFGQRHGLKILLEAARDTKTPVFILDLQQGASLAALESLNGLGLVKELQQQGLLVLPDVAFGDQMIGQWSLQANTNAAREFGLRRSGLFFGTATAGLQARYSALFCRSSDTSHLQVWNNQRIIPLPAASDSQPGLADAAVLSVETRRMLLQAALSPAADDLVVLGGALPQSPWGDLLMARPAFKYIASHPWIQALDEKQIKSFPAVESAPGCDDCLCRNLHPEPFQPVRDALQEVPTNLFSRLARNNFLNLTRPEEDPRLTALRKAYLGQIGPLLFAAQWVQHPEAFTGCTLDMNWDGQYDCVLASKDLYFVIDLVGGRLVFGAALTRKGPIQIVGQRSQFAIGLGDPSGWQPELGMAGDPEDIPGGFTDSSTAWQHYDADAAAGVIVLTHPQSNIKKTFQLMEHGLHVTIESSQPITTHLPLALIDNAFGEPGFYSRYRAETSADGTFTLNLAGTASVILQLEGAQLRSSSFLDSLETLARPEDPNFEYPPGHRIPFPLVIIELQGQNIASLNILVSEE